MNKLNRTQLKYLAVIAMILDHCAYNFYWQIPPGSNLWQIMHFCGRLADPVMAYFIAEGYIYTRDVKKYIFRLAAFTLISWLPVNLFVYGTWPHAYFGVIYTLMLGLLAVYFWDKSGCSLPVKLIFTGLLCCLSRLGDWSYINVIWPLIFYLYRDAHIKKWILYIIVSLISIVRLVLTEGIVMISQTGILIFPLIMEYCYSGEKGSDGVFHKWFFFIFYPAHMLVLYYLR